MKVIPKDVAKMYTLVEKAQQVLASIRDTGEATVSLDVWPVLLKLCTEKIDGKQIVNLPEGIYIVKGAVWYPSDD